MKQTGHGDLLTGEEKRALNADVIQMTNDDEVSTTVTYHYKADEAIDYETGNVIEVGAGSKEVQALMNAISRKEALDINVPVGAQILLIAFDDLDDHGIVPELWEHITIGAVEYEILEHTKPMPGLNYRVIINQRGAD